MKPPKRIFFQGYLNGDPSTIVATPKPFLDAIEYVLAPKTKKKRKVKRD